MDENLFNLFYWLAWGTMKTKSDNFLLLEQEKEEVDIDTINCEKYHSDKDDNS